MRCRRRRRNTVPGMILGTIGYMSPEQVRGGVADHRSDVFALGAVLYEMLSGRRAFQGDTAADVMSAILKEDPPDLPVAERHIPPALARIVGRCLEKSPAARFQSTRDLAFALEALSTHSGQAEASRRFPETSAKQAARVDASAPPCSWLRRLWLASSTCGPRLSRQCIGSRYSRPQGATLLDRCCFAGRRSTRVHRQI